MKNVAITILAVLFFSSGLFGFGLSFREDGGVDIRIVAVVGNRTILSSELDQAVFAMGYELPEDSLQLFRMYGQVLQDLINEELIYQAALAESIEVDAQTIKSEFSARWDTLTARFGGEERLADTLKKEGFSISEFKYKVKEQVKVGLLKQMYIQKHIGFVEVSDDDVKNFYEQNSDSLGEYPAQAHLFAILITPPPDSVLMMEAHRKAMQAYEMLQMGTDFEQLADSMSDDANTKGFGGKIGKFKIEDLPEEFQNVISKMSVGEYSVPVASAEGYHIIKLLAHSGDTVELAHIFFKTPSPQEAARLLAEAIYDSAVSSNRSGIGEERFTELVQRYSADSASAASGGDVGWFPLSAISQIAATIDTSIDRALQTSSTTESHIINKIIPPLPEANGWVIYKVSEIKPAERITLSSHKDIVREMARRTAFMDKLKRILKRLREQIYVEVRDERIAPYIEQ